MKKESLLVILFLFINVSILSASNEILLKSRRFTPAKGISDTLKAKARGIPQRVHVLIQLEKIPAIRGRVGIAHHF